MGDEKDGMLRELSGLQSSDEDVWGCAEVSFKIRTRSSDDSDLIERHYTFSHAPEWDKWTFTEFEEKRADANANVNRRNWRRSRHVMWHEQEAPTIDVPPEVTEELEDLLGLENLTIQTP